MGRPKKHYNHHNILPPAEKEITLSFNADPEKTVPGISAAAEALSKLADAVDTTSGALSALPLLKTKYWVVLEERRAALNGALVTVAKGKIVKSEAIAKRLMEQKVPLEEKTL
jgi:hypothetical protein